MLEQALELQLQTRIDQIFHGPVEQRGDYYIFIICPSWHGKQSKYDSISDATSSFVKELPHLIAGQSIELLMVAYKKKDVRAPNNPDEDTFHRNNLIAVYGLADWE